MRCQPRRGKRVHRTVSRLTLPRRRGRMVSCGSPIAVRWDASPGPRRPPSTVAGRPPRRPAVREPTKRTRPRNPNRAAPPRGTGPTASGHRRARARAFWFSLARGGCRSRALGRSPVHVPREMRNNWHTISGFTYTGDTGVHRRPLCLRHHMSAPRPRSRSTRARSPATR